MLDKSSAANQPPKLFFLIGLMGCGKSFWAEILSTENGFQVFDLDKTIEQEEKDSIVNIFKQKGETYFRNIETIQLKKTLLFNHPTIIATGGGTPCFNDNLQLMNSIGITIWLNESVENIVERITPQKLKRPLIENVENDQIRTYISSLLQDRMPYYSKCKFRLNSNEISKYNLLKIINQNA